MDLVVILVLGLLLLAGAYLVFRVLVRHDYRHRGHLSLFSSLMELLIWMLFIFFPYLYNPSDWALVWLGDIPVSQPVNILGSIIMVGGILIAAVSMAWLGIRKSFGRDVEGLQVSGPYRLSRNPQIVGGVLMVLGVATLWPSWYALGWLSMFGAISHMMVSTEEEHLNNVFGQDYVQYCQRVPRYLGIARHNRKPL